MSTLMQDPLNSLWNEPTQTRSRQKVDRLMDATLDLALEVGSLDVKMTEVAKRAGVAIGTLYQFFPTRNALIAKLFAREMKPIDAAVGTALMSANSFDELKDRIQRELSTTVELVKNRPGLSVIWSSASVDPAIEAADFANTRQNSEVLAERIASFLPRQTDRARIDATALLICHLWSSVVRLCLLSDSHEERALLEEYSRMLAAHGHDLSGSKAA